MRADGKPSCQLPVQPTLNTNSADPSVSRGFGKGHSDGLIRKQNWSGNVEIPNVCDLRQTVNQPIQSKTSQVLWNAPLLVLGEERLDETESIKQTKLQLVMFSTAVYCLAGRSVSWFNAICITINPMTVPEQFLFISYFYFKEYDFVFVLRGNGQHRLISL